MLMATGLGAAAAMTCFGGAGTTGTIGFTSGIFTTTFGGSGILTFSSTIFGSTGLIFGGFGSGFGGGFGSTLGLISSLMGNDQRNLFLVLFDLHFRRRANDDGDEGPTPR